MSTSIVYFPYILYSISEGESSYTSCFWWPPVVTGVSAVKGVSVNSLLKRIHCKIHRYITCHVFKRKDCWQASDLQWSSWQQTSSCDGGSELCVHHAVLQRSDLSQNPPFETEARFACVSSWTPPSWLKNSVCGSWYFYTFVNNYNTKFIGCSLFDVGRRCVCSTHSFLQVNAFVNWNNMFVCISLWEREMTLLERK